MAVKKEGKGLKITALVLGILGNLGLFPCYFMLVTLLGLSLSGFGSVTGHPSENSFFVEFYNLIFMAVFAVPVIGILFSSLSFKMPKLAGWFLTIEGAISLVIVGLNIIPAIFLQTFSVFNIIAIFIWFLPAILTLLAGIFILKKAKAQK
jgi:hypothetical protein